MELIVLLVILWPVAGFVGMILQWVANRMVRAATNGGETPYHIFPQAMIMGGYFTFFVGIRRFMMARSDPRGLLSMNYVNQQIFVKAASEKAEFIEQGVYNGQMVLKMVTDEGRFATSDEVQVTEEMTLSGIWLFDDAYRAPSLGSVVSVTMQASSNAGGRCTFIPKPEVGEMRFWHFGDNRMPTQSSVTMLLERGNIEIGRNYLFHVYINTPDEMPPIEHNNKHGVWISITDNNPYGRTFLVAPSPTDPESYIHEFFYRIQPI